MAKLKFITSLVLLLVALTFFVMNMERELNSFSFDSGFNLYENVDFNQEFIDYLEENNILVYKKKENYKPFYYTNNESMEKTIEIRGTTTDIYHHLLSEGNSGTYYLDFSNSNVTFSEFQKFITENYQVDIYFFSYEPLPRENIMLPLVALLSLLLVIMFLINSFVIKNKNMIKILTLSGQTNIYITKILVMELIFPILVSITIFVTLFLALSHYFSYFLIIMSLIIIVVVVLSIIIFASILVNNAAHNTKKKTKTLLAFAYVTNIIIIVVFITLGIGSFIKIIEEAKVLINLQINSDYYSQFYYVEGEKNSYYVATAEGNSQATSEKSQSYQKKLYDMGSITFDIIDEKNLVILVNENYLEFLGYSELTKYDYIVPISKKEEFLDSNLPNKQNSFYYEVEMEINSLDYTHGAKIKNPIINVDHIQTTGGNSFVLPATIPIDLYQQVIDENYTDSTDQQGVVLHTYDEVLENQKQKFIAAIDEVLLLFIIYLMLIFIITTYLLSTFYQKNKVEINVKRLHGKKYLEPLIHNFIIMNLIIVVICNFKAANLSAYVVLALLNILFYFCYRKVEKASRGKHA